MVDQLSFCTPNYSPFLGSIVPLVGGIPNSYVSVGTGLLKASSLIDCFPLPLPEVSHTVSMVSTIPHHPTDPWILPAPSNIDSYGEQMSLSPVEMAYQAIQSASNSPITLVTTNGTISSPTIAPSNDILNQVLPLDEAIQEIMCLEE